MKKLIKIGRSQSNQCVFDNDTVSGEHALLILDEDCIHGTIKDLSSKNGTFVNGKRISVETPIGLSDTIRLGSQSTSVSDILSHVNKTKINIQPNGITIGKLPTNKIVMNYDDVSRRHAVLYKTQSGQIVIEDCGSVNGTYVNGIKIKSQVLHNGDKVTITAYHPLDWEKIMNVPPAPPAPPVPPKPKLLPIIVASLAVLIICGGAYWWWMTRPWTKERVYEHYNKAVCWIYTEYGYKVYVDGEDFTAALCEILKLKPNELIYVDKDELKSGAIASQGTAFFISDDGKLATNLHITRPWLFRNDDQEIKSLVNKILTIMSMNNPLFSRSEVSVKGVNQSMMIIQNGLPISSRNAIACSEVKGYDDINKDVAIIQTETRKLPSNDINVLTLDNANVGADAYKVGRTIYTIGFPYGVDIALDSNNDLQNQVHSGSITQNKVAYEFSHDAETASGASGSPIIDDHGRLIGVHHAGVSGAQGFNMGIKAKYLQDLTDK